MAEAGTRVLGGPILVGVEADGRCDHAVRAALELGAAFDERVEFVHGVTPLTWHGTELSGDRREDVARRRMEHSRTTVGGHLDSLPIDSGPDPLSVRLEVLAGKPAKVLLDRAEEIDAGLVVLGPHARRGVFDFGNTARAVLSHAPCPVWVQVEAYRPIARVIAPVDLSDDSQNALTLAAALARRWDARLVIAHGFVAPDFAYPTHPDPTMPTYVVDEQRKLAHEDLVRFVERQDFAGLVTEVCFEERSPIELVLDMQEHGDLVVMGTHGRSGFAAAVLGSVAHGVLRAAHVPVVTVRHPDRASPR